MATENPWKIEQKPVGKPMGKHQEHPKRRHDGSTILGRLLEEKLRSAMGSTWV